MVFIHLSRGLTPHLCCPSLGDLVLAVGRSSYLQFDIVHCRPPAMLLPLNCDAATVWRHGQGQISAVSPLARQLLLRCCTRYVTGSAWWEGSRVRSGAVPGAHKESSPCAPVCYLLCLGGARERSWSICKRMKESWISCSVQGTCATVTGFKTKKMWNLKKDMLGLHSAASWDTGIAIGS